MTTELKRCPICHASAETTHAQAYARCNNVQCPMHFIKQCGVGEWNTRPIEGAQAKTIAELVECLKKRDDMTQMGFIEWNGDKIQWCVVRAELIAKHGKEAHDA